jgi:prepilin-type N-terminal cleavage/methylation domain-containing protein
MKTDNKGFTLIELMVVVIMLGIFVGLACLGGCVIKGCNHVSEHGVKSVTDRIMDGKAKSTSKP